MIIYIKLGKVRGLSVEINKNLGKTPLCNKNSFRHETVIDIPYVQLIYTSGRWRKRKRVVLRSIINVHQENKQTARRVKRANEYR